MTASRSTSASRSPDWHDCCDGTVRAQTAAPTVHTGPEAGTRTRRRCSAGGGDTACAGASEPIRTPNPRPALPTTKRPVEPRPHPAHPPHLSTHARKSRSNIGRLNSDCRRAGCHPGLPHRVLAVWKAITSVRTRHRDGPRCAALPRKRCSPAGNTPTAAGSSRRPRAREPDVRGMTPRACRTTITRSRRTRSTGERNARATATGDGDGDRDTSRRPDAEHHCTDHVEGMP